MAIYKTLLTYRIPDERHGQADVLGKTSTIQYEGPEKLILWLTKDENNCFEKANRLEDVWDADDMTERPIPGHCYQVELDAKAGDKECIIAGLIGPSTEDSNPFGYLKRYEIKVGPDDMPNSFVTDPTSPFEVYSKADLNEDLYDPDTKQFKNLVYKEACVEVTDDKVRLRRNNILEATDHKVAADDVPADIRKSWEEYRQKLRDYPATWKDVPNELIPWIKSPEEDDPKKGHPPYSIKTDPTIVSIEDRTAEDKKAIEQMWPIAGVDENAP
tara:strand:+ start:165 stop:980 length:816 start_codon:yes stop_codon:yes gene_type:complete